MSNDELTAASLSLETIPEDSTDVVLIVRQPRETFTGLPTDCEPES